MSAIRSGAALTRRPKRPRARSQSVKNSVLGERGRRELAADPLHPHGGDRTRQGAEIGAVQEVGALVEREPALLTGECGCDGGGGAHAATRLIGQAPAR